jgi:hypothetical protein
MGPKENIILAFNEVIQAGVGAFEIYEESLPHLPAFSVDVQSLVLRAGLQAWSYFSGNKVAITPRGVCDKVSCDLERMVGNGSSTWHVRTSTIGVLKDVAGNNLTLMDTIATWRFTVPADIGLPRTDAKKPEVAFQTASSYSGGVLTGNLYFTELIQPAGGTATISILDCGADIDCTTTDDNGSPLPITSPTYGIGDSGVVRFSRNVPYNNRRYQVTVPAGLVQDTAWPPNIGPTADYIYTIDVGVLTAPNQDTYCSADTAAYLSTSCDVTDTDGLRVGVTYDEHIEDKGRAEITGTGIVAFQGTDSVAMVPEGGRKFYFVFDASTLVAGTHYSLCMDLDGAAAGSLGFGDVGVGVYATPVSGTVTRALVTTGANASYQRVQFDCMNGCSEATVVHLALDAVGCDAEVVGEDTANQTVPTGLLYVVGRRTNTNSGIWEFYVNATLFSVGRHYNVCSDLDGPVTTLRVGDTGLQVFVTPVTDVTPLAIDPAPSQLLTITCELCSINTEVFLGEDCNASVQDEGMTRRLKPVYTVGNSLWTVEFDATHATIGVLYRFCLSFDISNTLLPAGDTGIDVYVRATGLLTPGIARQTSAIVAFSCAYGGCSSAATAYIAQECNTTEYAGTVNITNGSQTTSTPFYLNGSVWTAVIDSTALNPNANYQVCTDLDGTTQTYRFASIALPIFVSDVVEVTPSTLAKQDGFDNLTIRCGSNGTTVGCTPATEVFLSIDCSIDRFGNVTNEAFGTSSTGRPLKRLGRINEREELFTVELNNSELIGGRHYWVCLDADGEDDVYQPGNTGQRVYVSSVIEATPVAIRTDVDQTISLECFGDRRRRSEFSADLAGPRIVASEPALDGIVEITGKTLVVAFNEELQAGTLSPHITVIDWIGEAVAPSLVGIIEANPAGRNNPDQRLVLQFDTAVQAGVGSFGIYTSRFDTPFGYEIPAANAVFAQNKVFLTPTERFVPNEQYYVRTTTADTLRSSTNIPLAAALDTKADGHLLDVVNVSEDTAPAFVVWNSLEDYHCLPPNASLADIVLYMSEDIKKVNYSSTIQLFECGEVCGPTVLPGGITVPAEDTMLLSAYLHPNTTTARLQNNTIAVSVNPELPYQVTLATGQFPGAFNRSSNESLLRAGRMLYFRIGSGAFFDFGEHTYSNLSNFQATNLHFTVCNVSISSASPANSLIISSDQPFAPSETLGAKRFNLVLPSGVVYDYDGQPKIEVNSDGFHHELQAPD